MSKEELLKAYEEQIEILSNEINKQDDCYLDATYKLVDLFNNK